MRNREWWPWALSLGVLGVLYGPVVGWGPVAEDLQWAYKGWVTARDPVAFLQPFHQHYRPFVLAFFSLASVLFSDHWWLYRAASFGVGATVLVTAGRFLKDHAGLPAVAAATVGVLWLAAPLSDEVFFVTCEVQQLFYCLGVLLALWARKRESISGWFWCGVLLAFGSKEEAVVLPVLAVIQDAVLFRLAPRQIWRRTRFLWGFALAYLLVNRVLTQFEAGWFYKNPWLALPNLATTWTAFWHLHPPVLTGYSQALVAHWPKAVLAVVLTGLAVASGLARWRVVVFCFFAAGVVLAPTLPANVQSPRYTFLSYFFFLTGVAVAARELALRARQWRAGTIVAFCLVVISVAANDVLVVVGDREDWGRFQQLSARLDGELEPVLASLRQKKPVLLVRGNDSQPLSNLVRSPQGLPKLYFPRPDDPYGVVSVSALVSWRLRSEGIAAKRVLNAVSDRAPVAFVHEVGGFVPLQSYPVDNNRLFGYGTVLLEPVRALEFNPQAFP